MRRSNYPLRLQPSLMEEARKVAESEGVALNQLFNVAVAEKLATLRTEKRLWERICRPNRSQTPQILDRGGNGNPPMEQDEIPPDMAPDEQRTGETAKPAGRATPQFGQLKKRLEKAKGR